MATEQEIAYVYSHFVTKEPTEFLERINDTNAGIGAVLKILGESVTEVTAGDLAQKMRVSTARIAALLKKMSAKNLIERSSSLTDGRKVIVKLTEKGEKEIQKAKACIAELINMIIDEIGMDKVKDFIEINETIQKLTRAKLQKPNFD